MDDIAPALAEKVQQDFSTARQKDRHIAAAKKRLENGKATYHDCESFAQYTGEALARSLHNNVSSAALPDGHMYYNIARRVVEPPMVEEYDAISAFGQEVQAELNKRAGLAIAAQKAELDRDRIDGILNHLTSVDQYDDTAATLEDAVVNFARSVVDATVRKNADLHFRAGLRPKIVRRTDGKCCEWCSALAGAYDYEDVKGQGNDVWRRHMNCGCSIEYTPARGSVQIVYNYREDNTPEARARRAATRNELQDDRESGRMKARKDVPIPKGQSPLAKGLNKDGVVYIEPVKMSVIPTSDEIVNKIAGGDETKGSCASVAYAYVGNKAGYDTRDFRGGDSREFFARRSTSLYFAKQSGINSAIVDHKNDLIAARKLLSSVDAGKEYLLCTGKHVAVIRRVGDETQYLELQSRKQNGWRPFETDTLLRRFGCGKHSYDASSCVIEVDSLAKNQEFQSLLGYINTKPEKQKKGVNGGIR